jgi:frataxin-like iron-binding protein CyaY
MANQAPVFQLRLGSVSGAVFERSNGSGRTWYSTKVNTQYKDEKDGQWKDSSSFDEGDLANLEKVTLACLQFIIRQKTK